MNNLDIQSIDIIQHYMPGVAEILVNFTDRSIPDIFINGRDYEDGKVILTCSFWDDNDDRFFTVTFPDVQEEIGNLISKGLRFSWREKDQQYFVFIRFPKTDEIMIVGNIISEGKIELIKL